MGVLTSTMPPFSPMGNVQPYAPARMAQVGYPAVPMPSPYGNVGSTGLFPPVGMAFPSPPPAADTLSTFGPMPMSGGFPGQDTVALSSNARPSTVRPPRPMTPSSSYESSGAVDESWPESLNRPTSAALTPGARTVKRLEQPLVRFLDENPDIRQKIDNINLETLTDNITSTTNKYRVSLHNSFKHVPQLVDRTIIKQLDPNLQDNAQQLFAWIRKPPTQQELAAIHDASKSGDRPKAQRKRPADENADPFSAISWDNQPSKKQKPSYF